MKDKRNRHGTVGKSSSEKIFKTPPPLPLLCEISGAIHLAQPGLMVGRWQSDKIQVNFEIFKVGCLFNERTASLQPYQCIPAAF